MILSASRRTDIPAFFSDWFFNRIKEGNVCVRNPMNAYQVSRINISPEVTDCIVFWTKNPMPMMERLDELKKYTYYFQYTINAYSADTEPFVPPLEERLDAFRRLSQKIGCERVIWRYDPIILTKKYDISFHLDSIKRIASELKGYTEKMVFSFVDVYSGKNQKTLIRMGNRNFSDPELEYFVKELTEIAAENHIVLATCAEKTDLGKYGIAHNSCIDGELIERITGCRLKTKADNQRGECRCIKCEDIGSYDTCTHGCTYCYANFRREIALEKVKHYDPASPLLCDSIDTENDKITDRPVRSLKIADEDEGSFEQLKLF